MSPAQSIVVIIASLIIIIIVVLMIVVNRRQLREILELDDQISEIEKMHL